MADADTPRTLAMIHVRDAQPTVYRLPSGLTVVAYGDGDGTTLFFSDAALDRLTDAISTFRASEAQAEAA